MGDFTDDFTDDFVKYDASPDGDIEVSYVFVRQSIQTSFQKMATETKFIKQATQTTFVKQPNN